MIDVSDNNKKYYYHFDGLGSVVALSDISGNIKERYSYDVFGEPNRVSDVDNPYFFTGRRYDDETGLYHYRLRYYKPQIGRFLQTDPIGYYNSMNLYTYVGNNPLNWLDPWGLCKEDTSMEKFMDFIRVQRVERLLDDQFRHEKIADSLKQLPKSVKGYEHGNWWGNYFGNRGDHEWNKRLPGGYHLTRDPYIPGIFVHYDVFDPTLGSVWFWYHWTEEAGTPGYYTDWKSDWGK